MLDTSPISSFEAINPAKTVPGHQQAALEDNQNPVIIDMQVEEKASKVLVSQVLKGTQLNRVIAISHNAVKTASLHQKGFPNIVEHPMRGITLMCAIDDCVGSDEEE
ncbi:MAG: hypothetical protein AAF213_05970 [Pseudomonadota bacterium]